MMGLGTTCAATPSANGSGRMHFAIQGRAGNATLGDGVSITLFAGTGTPPANAAAVPTPGTAIDLTNPEIVTQVPANNAQFPFHISIDAGSLTKGSAYWFDLAASAIIGGAGHTTSITGLTCHAHEVM